MFVYYLREKNSLKVKNGTSILLDEKTNFKYNQKYITVSQIKIQYNL